MNTGHHHIRPHTVRHGFTLLELLVAMSVGLTVLAAAASMMDYVDRSRRVTAAKIMMERDAQLVMDWLRRDLELAGAGAPRGQRIGGNTDTLILPAIMPSIPSGSSLANRSNNTLQPNSFTILAAVPRPDTNFDGLSSVSDATVATNDIPILNELSGRVDRNTTPRMGALDPNANCNTVDSPGCPWALRKYSLTAGINNIQVINVAGNYENMTIQSFETSSGMTPNRLRLTSNMTGSINWPRVTGRVMQMHRIAYRIVNGTVQRNQCWAPLNLDNTGSATLTDNCTRAETGWMTLARNVQDSPTTRFVFHGSGLPPNLVTNPRLVRGVELQLSMRVLVRINSRVTRPTHVRMRNTFPLGWPANN